MLKYKPLLIAIVLAGFATVVVASQVFFRSATTVTSPMPSQAEDVATWSPPELTATPGAVSAPPEIGYTATTFATTFPAARADGVTITPMQATVQLPNPGPADGQITVNLAQKFQTMEGFGASQRVWTDPHVANRDGPSPFFPPAVQDEILQQLYTNMGLSRVRMSGAGYNTESAPGEFRFDCHAGDGCSIDSRISFVQRARSYGLQTVLSEANPMKWMGPGDAVAYADSVLGLMLHWRDKGQEPEFQTIVNEPSNYVPWADAGWHVQVVRRLGPLMRAAQLKTKLVIPDDINACAALPIARKVLEDTEAAQYVGAVAYHLYGGSRGCQADIAALAAKHNVPLWMTEHTQTPDYEGSMKWAKEIHELITTYNVSAVDAMWGFFGDWAMPVFNEEDPIQVRFDAKSHYASHRLTSKFYVGGQFARFVRPGYVRVAAPSTDPSILSSAYFGDGNTVLVVINDAPNGRSLNVSGNVSPSLPITALQTTSSAGWQQLPPVQRTSAGFHVNLPSQSVTPFAWH